MNSKVDAPAQQEKWKADLDSSFRMLEVEKKAIKVKMTKEEEEVEKEKA